MKLEKNTKGLPVLNDGEMQYDPETAVKVSVGGVNLLILTEVKNTEGEPNVNGGKESETRSREPRVDNSAIENRETASQDNATPQMGPTYPSSEITNR